MPVQSVVGVSTAATYGYCWMLAWVPPITLLPARGLAPAIPAPIAAISAVAQIATTPTLAIRESIVGRVGGGSTASS